MKWQPIETAPRDGSEFQCWWSGTWEPRCRFDTDRERFQYWGRTDFDQYSWDEWPVDQPTHWMPLPPPPSASDAHYARPDGTQPEHLTTDGAEPPAKDAK
jgi:hypothetical protein